MAIASRDFRELRLDGVAAASASARPARHHADGRPGEFVALVGPSGCGKSTALNCIAGLLQVTGGASGSISAASTTLGPEDRGFGMVFQNYALFPHMTVRRNIAFGLATQHRPKAEIAPPGRGGAGAGAARAAADKLPGQLSGGQQQRVAIARAVVVEPPLVLMDEPLSNLDAKLRLEMRAEIRRIHAMLGCSTIYVTHDQEEALSLADRIVVLIDGRCARSARRKSCIPRRPIPRSPSSWATATCRLARRAGGHGVAVTVAGGRLIGTPFAAVGGEVVVAIRPDDLHPTAGWADLRQVEIAEYHGRDFYAVARSADGTDLYFRSDRRVARRRGAPRCGALARAGLPRHERQAKRRCAGGCARAAWTGSRCW